jgi:fermentation-respiration switch protein FrsA (DUF1100 family)
VIHGTRDEIVPFWHGERLYRQAREPKLSLWVDGADHDNLAQVAGEEYWRGLDRFTRLIEGDRWGSPGSAQGVLRDSGK